MRRLIAVGVCAGALVLLAIQPGAQETQGLTPREEELLRYIQSLEERLTELEAIVKQGMEQKSPPPTVEPAPELEARVEQLETKLEQTEQAQPGDMRVFWRDGLRMQTADGAFEMRLGGRLNIDWGWFDDGEDLRAIFGDTEDGVEFRRARIDLRGTVFEDFGFRLEFDFAEGDSEFKDVYIEANNVPLLNDGTIRVGHFKEPMGLEQLTSDNDTTFMERAIATSIFTPERNTGVMVATSFLKRDEVPRMTAALGVFRETDDFGNGFDDGGYNWTGRVTGLAWYRDEAHLVHLGASASVRNIDGQLQLRERPESHFPARFIDTGAFPVDDRITYGVEAAGVYGPFSVQGEYFMSDVERIRNRDVEFDGWYMQASMFLTRGENGWDHRPYRAQDGFFDRVKPQKPFRFRGEGWGAFELAVRFSTLDLTDDKIVGGEEDNWTVGLNWYLNTNLRIMLNYIHADIDRSPLYEDTFEAFQARFQVAF